MDNNPKYLNGIRSVIGHKVYDRSPAEVADEIVALIDQSYFLILQDDLPEVELNSHLRGKLKNISEFSCDGDPEKLRKLGYEYLSMADFLGQKKTLEEDKLRRARWDAYSTLYPYQNMYEFETFDYMVNTQVNIQRAIDEIVKLRAQLDK